MTRVEIHVKLRQQVVGETALQVVPLQCVSGRGVDPGRGRQQRQPRTAQQRPGAPPARCVLRRTP